MTEPRFSPGTEDAWLIVKRGLFFRPNCQGYTGIRDEAGRYSEEVARNYGGECSAIHAEEAPEFMPAAYSDLVIKHLTLQRDELRREVARLVPDSAQKAGWQPIETKPADHFPVLIDGPYGIHTAFQDVTWTWYVRGGIELDYTPTRWRPLPERASNQGASK